jgi:hypothetical protein
MSLFICRVFLGGEEEGALIGIWSKKFSIVKMLYSSKIPFGEAYFYVGINPLCMFQIHISLQGSTEPAHRSPGLSAGQNVQKGTGSVD